MTKVHFNVCFCLVFNHKNITYYSVRIKNKYIFLWSWKSCAMKKVSCFQFLMCSWNRLRKVVTMKIFKNKQKKTFFFYFFSRVHLCTLQMLKLCFHIKSPLPSEAVMSSVATKLYYIGRAIKLYTVRL